jgi:epoxyqueuosine reductase
LSNDENIALEDRIKQKASELGFDLVGICRPDYSPEDHDRLQRWLDNGRHAEMAYMARNPRQRSDPRLFFEAVRSIISLGISYYNDPKYHPERPYISLYARGRPYQTVIKSKLKALLRFIQELQPGAKGKIAVDTSPTLDKLWAEKAGLGWRGKNTLLINREIGSFTFLGEIFLNLELEPDLPQTNLCADCHKCLDACPTGALLEPHLLDANLCISYLTIESDRPLDNPALIGNNLFGCDICQLACPYNTHALPAKADEFNLDFPNPGEDPKGIRLTEIEFKNRYSGTILGESGFNRYKNNAKAVDDNINRSPKKP